MIKGRGATFSPTGRFAVETHTLDEPLPAFETTVQAEIARSVITRNESPDIPFEQSINPYRGCEHGCIYCYARPAHAYMDLSPGLDFETRLFYKKDAAAVLEAELAKPGYRCSPIAFGANTDAYQPIERGLQVTRSLIEVLARHRHPLTIVTKSALVLRDLDLLAPMAADDLVKVFISVTTLDDVLKRTLEPRAASPRARLRTVAMLVDAGIPTGVMVAPVIPAVNDHEIEAIVAASADAGACSAVWQMLRLPHEVKDIFRAWLDEHLPDRAEHVMSLFRQSTNPGFGARMRGEGAFAALIAQRFRIAVKRAGLVEGEQIALRTDLFRRPSDAQLSLFA